MIVIGRDNFSEMLAHDLKARFISLEHRKFPDGESYFRVTDPKRVRKEKVVVVIRGESPGFNSDKILAEALIVLDYVRSLKPKKIALVLPYQPYARQDREFLPGEPVSVRIVRDVLKEKCDLLVNVASHDFRKEGWISDKIYNIDGTKSVVTFLNTKEFRNPVIVSPDMTEKEHARAIANAIGADTITAEKERDRKTGETEADDFDYDFGGKDVIIFDDITSSGETVVKALHKIRMDTPKTTNVVVLHAINTFNRKVNTESFDMIRKAGAKMFSSDTIKTPVTQFSVIPEIAGKLKEIF